MHRWFDQVLFLLRFRNFRVDLKVTYCNYCSKRLNQRHNQLKPVLKFFHFEIAFPQKYSNVIVGKPLFLGK